MPPSVRHDVELRKWRSSGVHQPIVPSLHDKFGKHHQLSFGQESKAAIHQFPCKRRSISETENEPISARPPSEHRFGGRQHGPCRKLTVLRRIQDLEVIDAIPNTQFQCRYVVGKDAKAIGLLENGQSGIGADRKRTRSGPESEALFIRPSHLDHR